MAIIKAVIGPVADTILEAYKDKNATMISKAEIEARIKTVMTNAALAAYKSGMDNAFKMFDSFQQSLRANAEIRRVWKIAVYSQLFFVVYLEMGVPALVKAGVITSWHVGSLDVWALGFLGASLGISPLVLKPPKLPGT